MHSLLLPAVASTGKEMHFMMLLWWYFMMILWFPGCTPLPNTLRRIEKPKAAKQSARTAYSDKVGGIVPCGDFTVNLTGCVRDCESWFSILADIIWKTEVVMQNLEVSQCHKTAISKIIFLALDYNKSNSLKASLVSLNTTSMSNHC